VWTRANAPMRMRCEYSRNRRLEDRRPSHGHHARCKTPPRDERRTVRVEIEKGRIAAKQTRCNALSPCPVGSMGGLAIGRPGEGSRRYVSSAWEDSRLLASFHTGTNASAFRNTMLVQGGPCTRDDDCARDPSKGASTCQVATRNFAKWWRLEATRATIHTTTRRTSTTRMGGIEYGKRARSFTKFVRPSKITSSDCNDLKFSNDY